MILVIKQTTILAFIIKNLDHIMLHRVTLVAPNEIYFCLSFLKPELLMV